MLIDLPKVTYTVLVCEMGSYDHTLCKGGLEPCVELRMTGLLKLLPLPSKCGVNSSVPLCPALTWFLAEPYATHN